MEDGSTWPSPAGPLLSKLTAIFVEVIAYTHVTRQEALDIIGFMLSNHSSLVHEQLFSSFIQHQLLERIPSTVYYRIVNTNVCGILTSLSACYSPTCNIRDLCYSPTCPNSKSECDLFTSTNSWLQRIPKHILQKTHRNELLRQAAIADLLSMEQSYLADLHILDEVYSKPLLSSACIPDSYRDSFHMLLFGNHRSLSKLHQRFCIELIQGCQKPNQILFGKVGDTIQQHIQHLMDPYIQYTGNHIRSSYALRMERHRNPSFCRFVDSQNGQPRTRRLSLGHFLSAPTLWIGKYRMLVDALAKRSSELPDDKAVLQQCVVSLQELLSKMNQAATNAGHDTRRAHVTACLALSVPSYCTLFTDTTTSFSNQWLFPYDAKLLQEGKMWLQRSTMSPLPTTTVIRCHVFLFDHMLFITQAKMVDGMEEYALVAKPIPLAAFVWMDSEQYNHNSSSSLLIHRLSRQLSSKISVKSSTIWSTLRRTPSTSFQQPSPPIGTLSSSKSTPIISPPTHQSMGSASRLCRRLRTNRWSSSPIYTHSSSSVIHSLSLSSPDQQLNRRQSVPELSFYNNSIPEKSNSSRSKTNGHNTIPGNKRISILPLTPIESRNHSSSSPSSTTSSSSSSQTAIYDTNSSTNAAVCIPSLESDDDDENNNNNNTSTYLQFAHSGSIETPFILEFDDTQSCQLWRDTINSALSTSHPPYSLSAIWEQPSSLKNLAQEQQRNEASAFKRLSTTPWSSVSTSTSSMPGSLSSATSRRKSDPDENIHNRQIHCAFTYRTENDTNMIALGTQNGVWIGSENQMDDLGFGGDGGLRQIIAGQACHRLVMINGMLLAMIYNPKHMYSLVAYPLVDNIMRDDDGNHRQQKDTSSGKKSCVVKRDWVISMAVGRLYQQTVLVYLTRYGSHILAVVAIPRTHAPWFRKVKEYTVRLKDANNISIHDNTLYIQSNKYGVESIVPSRKRETSVQWQNISNSPCIAYIPLSTGHGLVTSTTGICRVNLSTSSSTTATNNDSIPRTSIPAFEFESHISSISLDYPFVIAFGLSLVEIWNIELNKLVQVFHSPSLRLLYDSDQCVIDNKKQQHQQPKDRTILVGPFATTTSTSDKNNKSIPFRIYEMKTIHQPSHI